MVDEITPTYYAAGLQPTYVLTGSGFDKLPNDVIGVKSVNNTQPLMWRNDTTAPRLYELVEKSDTRIVFRSLYQGSASSNAYLGGILTNDRSHAFWVNNSQPLPPTRGDIVDLEIIDER